jgi:hypothetical protein
MSLANPQSLNRYAYVQNDPVNFVDPLGLNLSSGTAGFCSAEFSYSQCGGDAGFWGGGHWGDWLALFEREFGGMPEQVSEAL